MEIFCAARRISKPIGLKIVKIPRRQFPTIRRCSAQSANQNARLCLEKKLHRQIQFIAIRDNVIYDSRMSDPVGLICSSGACESLDPAAALIIIALDSLAKELNKKEPFGPNNEIVKALRTIQNDLLHGLGPNNDAVKVINNAWSDLTKGPGPNNDIRKALESIGIKL